MRLWNDIVQEGRLSNCSSSGGATEESLAAYADRTLYALGASDASLDIFSLTSQLTLPQKTILSWTLQKFLNLTF